MRVEDFNKVIGTLKSFKSKLIKEGIIGQEQQKILKIFLATITSNKINVSMLKVI